MAQGKMKVKNSFVKKAKNRNQKPLGPKKGGKKCQSSAFIFKMQPHMKIFNRQSTNDLNLRAYRDGRAIAFCGTCLNNLRICSKYSLDTF